MDQLIVIERTLAYAQEKHVEAELRALRDRLARLESQVRILAAAVGGQPTRPVESTARTRPRLVK